MGGSLDLAGRGPFLCDHWCRNVIRGKDRTTLRIRQRLRLVRIQDVCIHRLGRA